MTLAELLTPERIIPDLAADSQLEAIGEMVGHLVSIGDLSEEQRSPALSALKAREEQRSTGIGGGVAIPHAFLPGLENVVAVFARSEEGVEFCALDRALVHFVVCFIVPEAEHGLHLKTLAAIAKTLNSADTRNRLAGAQSTGEILEIFGQRAAAA